MKKEYFNYLKIIASVIIGNFLYALSVKLFLLPAGLVTGGTTGIALLINHITGFSVSGFVFIFNLIMLIAGYLMLGKAFALTTIASTFLYPIFLESLDHIFAGLVISQDIFLCTLFSGLGIGISLGLVIRAGASTGGMDIPPLVLQKYFHIPVSVSLYLFDFLILCGQGLFQNMEKVLYGIVLILIYTLVLDKMLLMGETRTEIKIVSKYADEIRDAILNEVDRGVTVLHGEGGYLHKEQEVLLSIISNRELPQVQRIIYKIDPECFMIVSHVSEVSGRGFSLKKRYR